MTYVLTHKTSRVIHQPMASASRGDEHPEIDPRYVQFFVDPLNPGAETMVKPMGFPMGFPMETREWSKLLVNIIRVS